MGDFSIWSLSVFFPLTTKSKYEEGIFCLFLSMLSIVWRHAQQPGLSYSRWCAGCWPVIARRCGLGWHLLFGSFIGPLKWVQSSYVGAPTAYPWAVFCGLNFITYPWSLHFLLVGMISIRAHGSSILSSPVDVFTTPQSEKRNTWILLGVLFSSLVILRKTLRIFYLFTSSSSWRL